MRPLLRFFDWRFLTAMTTLVLVGSVCWTTIAQARDNEAKTEQIDHLVSAIADEQASSARQRDRLLDGQQRLERQYNSLLDRQRVLVRLLEEYGVPASAIPPELQGSRVTIRERDNDDNDDDDDDEGDTIIVRPPSTSNPTPRPTRPADDDDDDGETVPDVDDLTDMTDDIVDDLLNSVPEQ